MTGYVVQRLALFIPTIILVSFVVFGIMRFLPGDPALAILSMGGEGSFTDQDLQRMREKLGTDKPYHIQYVLFVKNTATGDFGESFFYPGIKVADMLKTRFPLSIELAIFALTISYVIAVPIGVLSAVKQDSWFDYATRIFTIGGVALPTFWVGILVIFTLAKFFNWLPPLGYAQIYTDPLTNLQQLVFPACALGYFNTAFATRVTRSAMLEVMREDYIRTARSKGLRERIVIFRHALRNALLPIITITGLSVANLISGTVITESVFEVPGLGRTVREAASSRDYAMLQSMVITIGAAVMVINLLTDIAYGWIDPRIRYS